MHVKNDGKDSSFEFIYAYSLMSAPGFLSTANSERGRLIQALLPVLGILWYGAALLLLQVFCRGSFGCTAP